MLTNMSNNFKDYLFSTYKIPTDLLEDFFSGSGTPSSILGFNLFIPGETHFISISANCPVDIIDDVYVVEDKIFYDFGVFEYSVSDIAWFSNMLNPKKKVYEENLLNKESKVNLAYLDFLSESIVSFTDILKDTLTDYSLQKSTGNEKIKTNQEKLKDVIYSFKSAEKYLTNCLDKNVNTEYLLAVLHNKDVDMLCDIVKGCEVSFMKNKLEKELKSENGSVKQAKKI